MEDLIANVKDIKFDIETCIEQQLGIQPLPFPGMDSEYFTCGTLDISVSLYVKEQQNYLQTHKTRKLSRPRPMDNFFKFLTVFLNPFVSSRVWVCSL